MNYTPRYSITAPPEVKRAYHLLKTYQGTNPEVLSLKERIRRMGGLLLPTTPEAEFVLGIIDGS